MAICMPLSAVADDISQVADLLVAIITSERLILQTDIRNVLACIIYELFMVSLLIFL